MTMMKRQERTKQSEIYVCGRCGTHLTSSEYVVDRQFKGRTGTAYLIASCVNVEFGEEERRQLTTGVHQEQKYIIGHSCFEMALVLQEHAFQRVASLSKSVDDEMSSGDFREEEEDDDDDDEDENENENENKEEEERRQGDDHERDPLSRSSHHFWEPVHALNTGNTQVANSYNNNNNNNPSAIATTTTTMSIGARDSSSRNRHNRASNIATTNQHLFSANMLLQSSHTSLVSSTNMDSLSGSPVAAEQAHFNH
ncbi:C2H2-type zinc finger-containing protein, partial [Reticulomyxa filosa]